MILTAVSHGIELSKPININVLKKNYLEPAKNGMKLSNFILMALLMFVNKGLSQCPNPPGDPLASGNNSWIGYVYADTNGSNPPSDAFTTTYRGFVTENDQFDESLGTNPLTGPNLCGSYTNNFAIRYRMQKTFAAGYYIFTTGGSDGYRLSIDGGLTYLISNWTNHPYQSTSASYYLSGTINLVLEYYNQNNDTRINFSYQSCGSPSTAPTQISSLSEICGGSSLTLTAEGGVAATGSVYQWGTGNTIGSNILADETAATLAITPEATTTYWVRRLDPAPCTLATSGISKTITVTNGSIAPESITGNVVVCYGDNTTLTATGYSGNVQWQSSNDGETFNDILGENGPVYAAENLTNSIFLRVMVKNGSCQEVYSERVQITINTPSVAGTISGAQTVCASENTTTLNLEGYLGSIQWQSSTDNINFTDVDGETTASLTALNLNTTTYYRTRITSGLCEAVFSNPVSIIVNPAPFAGTVSASNEALCADISSTTLNLSGYVGSIQWEQSDDNINFSPILNATTQTINLTNLAENTYYRAAVSTSSCLSVYSDTLLITVNSVPVAGSISGASIVCSGANSTELTANGYLGAIKWQSSTDNINFNDIEGANGPTYVATDLGSTTFFRIKVGSENCAVVYSSSISIVVKDSPVGGSLTGDTTVCTLINASTLTLSGYTGNIQWQSSLDGNIFTDILDATSPSYTATNIAATTFYRAQVTIGDCPADFSNTATLAFSAPIAGTISGAGTICLGSTPTLTLNGYNGDIQWQCSTDNVTFTNIPGANSANYIATGYTVSTYFRVLVTGGDCGSNISPSVLVLVTNNSISGGIVGSPGSAFTPILTSSNVVSGFNNIVLTASGYTAGSTLQWQSSTDNVNFLNIANASAVSYTVSNVTTNTYYRVAVTSGTCTAYSAIYSVTICTPTGNQATYGSGTNWRIYYYSQHDGTNPPSDAFSATYRGFTTSNGVETYDYVFGASIGGNVCGSNWNNTNGAFRYRLTRNFPAGDYIFRVGSNGGYRMSVDGGATWLIDHWTSTGTYNTMLSPSVSLSGNVNLVIEYFNLATYNPRHTFNYCETNSGAPAPTVIKGSSSMCLGTNTTLSVPYSYSSTCQWGTGTVVGENIISNNNGGAIFISPLVTTTYWVRRYNSICNTYSAAAFKTVTVNPLAPQTPAGNTSDYGNGQWIGYVYASKTGTWPSTPAIAFNNPYVYAGYLTTPSDTFSFGAWVGSTTPAQFTAATMCGYFEQYFSVRYKMTKNFAPGYYTFTISADDGARLSIDGGVTWVINKWTASQTTYSAFLNGPTNLVLEYAQGSGDYSLNFNYTSCTNYSTAPTTIAGTTTICNGSSTTLTASGGYAAPGSTFQWGIGDVIGANILANTGETIVVSPSVPTTYWVRRKNGSNCNETAGGVTTGAFTSGITTAVNVAGTNAVAGSISGGGNSVCSGSNSTLLSLVGSVGSIQWQSSEDNTNWTDIPNENGTTYSATDLTATTYYRVVLTSGDCAPATTNSINIIVNPLVTVAGSIGGAGSVCANTNSSALVLSGYNGTLQWQVSADNVNFNNIAGATSPVLNVFNISVITYYRVVVSNGACSSATSESVAIVVTPTSISGTVSGSATVCSGANNSALTLNGYLGSIQWQASDNNINFTSIEGATSPIYNAIDLTSTKYYRALVTNNTCSSAVSNTVRVFVNQSPDTGTINGAATVCYGTNSATLSLTGSNGAIQWQSSTNNINFTNIPLATTSSLTVYNLTQTTYYRVTLSNGLCTSTYPGSVAVNVNPISVAGIISGATTVCSGTNAVLTLNNYTGNVQWQSSTDNTNFVDIAGATDAILTTDNLTATTYFKAVVTSGVCNSVSTTTVTVYVRPASFAGTAFGGDVLCSGINTTGITLTGYVGSIQWQSSIDNINFTNIFGATSSNYTAINLTETKFFRAVVTTNLCSSSISNVIEVTVLPYATAGTITIPGTSLPTTTVCAVTNATPLTLLGSAGIPQWQSSTDNLNFTDIVGANVNTYTASGLTVTTWFRAVLTSGSCGDTQTTTPVLINVPAAVTYDGAWSGVPNAYTTIVVSGDLTLSGNINVCSCQLTGASHLTVPGGVTMLVQKNIVVDPSASLVVENNGSIVQVDNSAVNSGSITFKRDTSPLLQSDFIYFATPVAGQTLGLLASPSAYSSYDPSVNNWVSESESTTMAPAAGYIVQAPSNLDYSTPQTYNAVFHGIPNNGIISFPITKGSGSTFNLIGNPYPSAIDIDQFISDAGNSDVVNGTIYLWSHNKAKSNTLANPELYTNASDGYAKYNLTGGVNSADPAITGGTLPNGKIAAGQGFFIEANDGLADGTYTAAFTNNMRVTGQNSQFYRSTPIVNPVFNTLEKHRIWLNIVGSNGAYDQALLGYVETATNGFDSKFDGRVLPTGNTVSIYTVAGTENLSIQGRVLPFDDTDVIPLGYTSQNGGDFSIGLEIFDGLFQNQEVYLLDKTANISHNLKVSPYTFSTDNGTFNDRFEIHFIDPLLGTDGYEIMTIGILQQGAHLLIDAGQETINSVQVYDILGKTILAEDHISRSVYTSADLNVAPQLLIVRVVLTDGTMQHKKILKR
ncbi:MAG: hypothetical protein CFE23_09635 [Flavobacterium sp. BFFFF1]|nr:MAG: hypothetical protein CFE23_09635 [Flavobacterium sp. BFFFF1]